jgi:hypothetical protein
MALMRGSGWVIVWWRSAWWWGNVGLCRQLGGSRKRKGKGRGGGWKGEGGKGRVERGRVEGRGGEGSLLFSSRSLVVRCFLR